MKVKLLLRLSLILLTLHTVKAADLIPKSAKNDSVHRTSTDAIKGDVETIVFDEVPFLPGNYYVDPVEGDDSNPGSRKRPWKTLNRVFEQNLKPGQTVNLRRGKTHKGTLALEKKSSGTANQRVTITTYKADKKDKGKAIIKPNGKEDNGLVINEANYVTVVNVEVVGVKSNGQGIVVNKSKGVRLLKVAARGFKEKGIVVFEAIGTYIGESNVDKGGIVVSESRGVILEKITAVGNGRLANGNDGIIFDKCLGCTIKNSSATGYGESGLLVYGSDNFTADGITANSNGFAGIGAFGLSEADRGNRRRTKNMTIKNSVTIGNAGVRKAIDNHNGNGIVAGDADNITIERCYASGNGAEMLNTKNNGPVGIWLYQTKNSIIQYCISSRNLTGKFTATEASGNPDRKAGDFKGDGGGFDLDGGVENSIMQYNISYDNVGAGYGLYQYKNAAPWKNNIIRYNVSENDGYDHGGSINIWTEKGSNTNVSNAFIYNNTLYNEKKSPIIYYNELHSNINFSNNIILYYEVKGVSFDFFFQPGDSKEVTTNPKKQKYFGNLWYKIPGPDKKPFDVDGYTNFAKWAKDFGLESNVRGNLIGKYANPRFERQNNTKIVNPNLIKNYDQYSLKASSPAINSGLNPYTRYQSVHALSDIRNDIQDKDLLDKNNLVAKKYDMGAIEFQSNTATKSTARLIEIEQAVSVGLSILKNPTDESNITIKLTDEQYAAKSNQTDDADDEVTVQLIDMSGHYYYNKSVAREKVQNQYTLDQISGLTSGNIYIVIVKDGTKTYSDKLILN